MGIMATILRFIRVSKNGANWPAVVVEDRKGDNREVEFFQTSGDDSPPLPNDNVALISAQRQGGKLAVGIIDNKNIGSAVPGEKRIYARSPAGAVVSELHLKGDGSVILQNIAGTYILEIDAAGVAVFTCTELTVIAPQSTFEGDVMIDGGLVVAGETSGDGGPLLMTGGIENTGGDITSDGISLELHTHGGVVSGGDNTDVPQ